MPKKQKKPSVSRKNPGLGQASKPVLNRQDGGTLVAESVVDQIKRKREELEELSRERISVLLKQRDVIQDELDELGYKGDMVKSSSKEKKGTKTLDKPCKICGFLTEPYHDARLKAHRDQKVKEPLTDDQLAANDPPLKKVE